MLAESAELVRRHRRVAGPGGAEPGRHVGTGGRGGGGPGRGAAQSRRRGRVAGPESGRRGGGTVLDHRLLLLVSPAAVLGYLVVRRVRLMRGGGVDVCLRRRPASQPARRRTTSAGWHFGVGRYQGNELAWYRLTSLRPGPSPCWTGWSWRSWTGARLAAAEVYAIPQADSVLRCRCRGATRDRHGARRAHRLPVLAGGGPARPQHRLPPGLIPPAPGIHLSRRRIAIVLGREFMPMGRIRCNASRDSMPSAGVQCTGFASIGRGQVVADVDHWPSSGLRRDAVELTAAIREWLEHGVCQIVARDSVRRGRSLPRGTANQDEETHNATTNARP